MVDGDINLYYIEQKTETFGIVEQIFKENIGDALKNKRFVYELSFSYEDSAKKITYGIEDV